MAEQNEMQETVMEFERNRGQLMTIANQKQQLQLQSMAMNDALTELEKTTEKKVYRAVGNILVLSSTAEVIKELKVQKESIDLKVKTLQKQEDMIVDKLNKIKNQIESKNKPKEEKK